MKHNLHRVMVRAMANSDVVGGLLDSSREKRDLVVVLTSTDVDTVTVSSTMTEAVVPTTSERSDATGLTTSTGKGGPSHSLTFLTVLTMISTTQRPSAGSVRPVNSVPAASSAASPPVSPTADTSPALRSDTSARTTTNSSVIASQSSVPMPQTSASSTPPGTSTTNTSIPNVMGGSSTTTASTDPINSSPSTFGTSSSDFPVQSHRESRHSIMQSVVASVVPVVVVTACILLYLWWKNRLFLRRKAQEDLERNAVWLTRYRPHSSTGGSHTVDEEKQQDDNDDDHRSPETALNSVNEPKVLKRSKSRPGSLLLPPRESFGSNRGTTSRDVSTTIRLEDPFLSPRSPTFPPDANLGQPEVRASQIGLAVSTPHHNNNSTVSLAESIRTIIHHATNKLSNPFKDPAASTESIPPPPSKSSSPIVENQHRSGTTNDEVEAASRTESHCPKTLSESNTPPEALARRWIEVLKLEAAQAQEAADDAAEKASQLRRHTEVSKPR